MSLIPTPRQISSDCGMVVQVGSEDLERAQAILKEHGLKIEGIYEIRKDGMDRRRRKGKEEGVRSNRRI